MIVDANKFTPGSAQRAGRAFVLPVAYAAGWSDACIST
jgi:hypothetical protein